jgi:hypothetical protein
LAADLTLTVAAVTNTTSGVAVAVGATGTALISTGTAAAWGNDFGAQTLTTTGDFILGATPAATGDLRVPNGFTFNGRNSGNTLDRGLFSWGVVTAAGILIGEASASFPNIAVDATNVRIDFRINTVVHARITANVLNLNPAGADFSIQQGGVAYFGFETTGAANNLAIFNNANVVNFQSGDRIIHIANRTAGPTGNPANGGFLFADAGAGKWLGSGGTTTTFGPADPHCPRCDRDFALEWENPKYGKLSVCMWCLTEVLNARGMGHESYTIKKEHAHEH